MPTLKQAELAKAIVENVASDEPKTAGELLESVGYAETTARAEPGRTIEQKGVQEELERLGFTEDAAKEVVAEILNNKTAKGADRLKAADLIFKVKGSYAPEKKELSGAVGTMSLTAEVLQAAEELLKQKKVNSQTNEL